jgi:hypothetical protein
LAGTTGSRPPSFPIQRDGEVSLAAGARAVGGIITPPIGESTPVPVIPEAARPIATVGALTSAGAVMAPPAAGLSRVLSGARRNAPSILQVWVPFEGARWVSSGDVVAYSPDRFVQVGDRGGFPVYRAKNGNRDLIYIPSIAGGALAPYKKTK